MRAFYEGLRRVKLIHTFTSSCPGSVIHMPALRWASPAQTARLLSDPLSVGLSELPVVWLTHLCKLPVISKSLRCNINGFYFMQLKLFITTVATTKLVCVCVCVCVI